MTITPRQFSTCYEPLTAAEMRIVQTICAGYTKHEEIAAATGVKLRTVANHLYAIYKKLGVSNEAALVLYAIRAGWFDEYGRQVVAVSAR